MTNEEVLDFVQKTGVVLESARSPLPNVAERVAGERIRGSWWAHPAAEDIFRVTRFLRASPQVLTCPLVDGKITFVHRRLWPALVRLAERIGPERLACIRDVHTPHGHHRREVTPFPEWVPEEVFREAQSLSDETAEQVLAELLPL